MSDDISVSLSCCVPFQQGSRLIESVLGDCVLCVCVCVCGHACVCGYVSVRQREYYIS